MHPGNTAEHTQDFVDERFDATSAITDRMQPRAMGRASLASARFGGDIELLRAIRDDEALTKQLQRTEVLRRNSRIRAQLLGNAVRVHTKLVPNVARSLERVAAVLSTSKPLEAYVFAKPLVDAFVSEANSRYLVGLSSGAVNTLSAEELEFVIGHELGHAAFGHLDVAAEAVIDLDAVSLEQCMLLRAWQRAAEISADRVGLLCCNSLEVAATAMFKMISGLDLPGVVIEPAELAQQWNRLAEELLEHGVRDHWKLTHPFPPLRMQALLLFWSRRGQPEVDHEGGRKVDREVARLLAHMDAHRHASTNNGHPLLSRFSFWGSLYVALADRRLDRQMLHELAALAPPGLDTSALLHLAGSPDAAPKLCLTRFREAKQTRRGKLSSKEIHALISELIAVAARGGRITRSGVEHVTNLGQELGIGPHAVRLLIAKRRNKE